MASPRFSVYAFNPLSGSRVGEPTVYREMSYTEGLAGTGSGTLEVPWYGPYAASITPMNTGIVVDDGGLIRWSGLVTMREISPEDESVRFGLTSWWEYYMWRWIRSRAGMTYVTADPEPLNVPFAAVDQFRIVSDLLDHAANVGGAANLGLTVRMHGPGAGGISGVNRTHTYYGYERKRIAQAVGDLSDQQDGFDFTVGSEWNTASTPWTVDRYLDLYYPRRGNASGGVVLEHGTNVTMLRLVTNGLGLANPVQAIGAGTGEQTIAEAEDSSYRYPAGLYPYTESEVWYRDEGVEFDDNLLRLALAALARTRQPLSTATVTLTEQPNGTRLGDISLGDSLRTVAQFGDFAIDERLRVVSQSVTITPVGLESWAVDLVDDDASLGG